MCLGIPGRIVEIADAERKLAVAEVGGTRRQVSLACLLDGAHPAGALLGEWVLVHQGFAMSRIDEAQAALTLALLAELGEAQAGLQAAREPGSG